MAPARLCGAGFEGDHHTVRALALAARQRVSLNEMPVSIPVASMGTAKRVGFVLVPPAGIR